MYVAHVLVEMRRQHCGVGSLSRLSGLLRLKGVPGSPNKFLPPLAPACPSLPQFGTSLRLLSAGLVKSASFSVGMEFRLCLYVTVGIRFVK